jgi:hypothetical protein
VLRARASSASRTESQTKAAGGGPRRHRTASDASNAARKRRSVLVQACAAGSVAMKAFAVPLETH